MGASKEPLKPIKPVLKWAGGKRWFTAAYAEIIPKKFNRYIEPFLGGGAVFFHLRPGCAILGDSNRELIETYQALKDDWRLVWRYLLEHHRNHSQEYYYRIRGGSRNSLASKAARFIYLNRTCWNGLYRVNLNGVFNVPIGTKSSVIFNDDQFDEVSSALQCAELHTRDFEDLIDMAHDGDLVFADPPYTVRHNNNAFIKYNEKLFSWYDQQRLLYALKRASNRGAYIVGTNAYHQCVRKLYEHDFETMAVSRNSPISSKVESRKRFEELIILSESVNAKSS